MDVSSKVSEIVLISISVTESSTFEAKGISCVVLEDQHCTNEVYIHEDQCLLFTSHLVLENKLEGFVSWLTDCQVNFVK